MAEMTFNEAIDLFRGVYHRFEKIEGYPWRGEGAMIELMKQVGELAKCVMVTEQYYFAERTDQQKYATTVKNIGDELADIFGQVIRIADYYKIDLVEAHIKARRDEDAYLTRRGIS
ncbi:MazG-like family protein [Desulfobacula phenolica]|uniref:MazG nucleotide pyrophosphohydrolase domain-containing protein n=1 Tax=Desulfobacula phenolica TaxID=90732 RepID=A0A1H2K8Y0_9BACT|nr:MazG-like family protein [Desulfobacula phenolica]SDU64858.1 hypothetical protein SAMN04487931_1237 [Desulfobacula phenolica]